MKNHPLLLAVSALALAALACQAVNIPAVKIETTETVVEKVQIAPPQDSGDPIDVVLAFGAGELNIEPGSREQLIEGTVTYNISDLKPEITESAGRVQLSAGDINMRRIPRLTGDMENQWDLRLGDAPINLTLEAGAYDGNLELGGLALHSLTIQDGAADVDLSFSESNQVEMDRFSYETGASHADLEGLANANFEELTFTSGAGEYTLDFSGDLQRDARVIIEAGLSSLSVIVPEDMNVELEVEGDLSPVEIDGRWEKNGNTYTVSGSGPKLTVHMTIGAGSITLRTR